MTNDIKNLFKEFKKECLYCGKRSEITVRGYEYAFKLFLQFLPNAKLKDINVKTLSEFFKWLETRERIDNSGRRTKGVKNSTIATYRHKLNVYFDWLKSMRKIKENPFDSMPYPNVRYDDIKYLKQEEVSKIFTALLFKINWKNNLVRKRNNLIFELLLYTGVRKNELLNLKLLDINLDRKEIIVRAETSKSKREREIPIHNKLFDSITDYIDERNKRNYTSEYLLVSNNSDNRFSEGGLKHLMEIVKDESGISFHMHRFRHTFAINYLENDNNIAKLQQIMGHTNIKSTLPYTRRLPSKAFVAGINKITLDNLI